MNVGSKSRKIPLEKVIAALLAEGSGTLDWASQHDLEQQLQESLRKQQFDNVTLNWVDEQIQTRIDFIDAGPEFLFFWRDIERTHARVDAMLDLFYSFSEGLASADYRTIWTHMTALPDGEVVSPSAFMSQFKVESGVVERVILDAVNAGLLEPVYQLKASDDLLEEHGLLDWTNDLISLRSVFRSDAGDTVDGSDPTKIRVAFKRTFHTHPAGVS